MIVIRAYRWTVPLALAAVLGLLAAASAQQSPTPKDAKPAAKSTKEKSAPAPAPAPAPARAPAPAQKSKSPAAIPAPGGGQPNLLGQFGDWGAYTATNAGKKVCYALAKPSSSATEPNRPRDPAYIFVSTRPAENVRNEISIIIGYPFKPGLEASADIGSSKYALFTQQDGAWVKNPAEEARMVDTMRRGSDMVISGESGRGTKSTDRYALKGLAQALDRVAQECR
jgi:invasion protein IalB